MAVFRIATVQDANAIKELTLRAYAKWIPVIGREPLPMLVDYNLALEQHRFDLLIDDGVLIGLLETIDKSDHLFIENIAVNPVFQNKGYGGAILNKAEKIARSLGYETIKLLTNKAFDANIRLYLKFGYSSEKEEAFKNGVTVNMTKTIQGR